MKVMPVIVLGALAVPVLLVFAVALGPVLLGILCAVGFGLIVFVAVNAAIGVGVVGRSVGKAGVRHLHHAG